MRAGSQSNGTHFAFGPVILRSDPWYIQLRWVQQAAATGGSVSPDHEVWGWGGDVVWIAIHIGILACGPAVQAHGSSARNTNKRAIMRIRALSCLLLVCLAGYSRAVLAQVPDSAQVIPYTVDPKESKITLHVVHPFHKVDGVSTQVTGAARVLPGGRAQAEVQVPVTSFLTGNVNRDEEMRMATDVASFPTVDLKAFTDNWTLPAAYPASQEKYFTAQLTFYGTQEQIGIPVQLIFESPGRIRVTASFSISLNHFKVERPSLFFVKVEDTVRIDVSVLFKR